MFRTNPLLRLLAVNCAIGMMLGALLVGGIMYFDSAGIRTMIMRDAEGLIAAAALLVAFMTMGGSIMMGTAVMTWRHEDSGPRGGKRLRAGSDVSLAPVRAVSRRR